MANSAFDAITTRNAWYSGVALAQHEAVMYDAAGKYVKADGSRPFAGIVEYGCDAADQMVTVVRGVFSGIAASKITAGAYLVLGTDTSAGCWAPTTTTGTAVIGIALTAATAGETLAVQMLETPFTIPA